jgi:hypothetical protein
MTVQSAASLYPVRLEVDYPDQHNRVTTLFRVVLIIPIGIVIGALTSGATQTVYDQGGQVVRTTSGGITAGLIHATLLMIVFRKRYPRWWFDFALEVTRFGARVGAYFVLLTDQYPSTVEEQSVHLQIDYPDVERDLNRWLPLVKWLLAIPHFLVLIVLSVVAFFAVVIAWFTILLTGGYPRGLFDFVVGVGRWGCASRRTRSFSSPTAIRPSRSPEPAGRRRTSFSSRTPGQRQGGPDRPHGLNDYVANVHRSEGKSYRSHGLGLQQLHPLGLWPQPSCQRATPRFTHLPN